ncbi:phosphatase PAP2 family protein [Paenibacillus doosanensis]|uniref:phosphatase PAP2 family protein n=1 Tax=Paenibacillus doosanensis TaxID=1229154 RepID=UPI00217FBBF1|nr:phosphatase PAP2 family protein [Paenibacillus doosanensis]MCS7464107.1 phosphatase PAP2 family protein [Paenibacillus doosanensis]
MKIIRSLWPLCLMALIPLSNIFYMQVNTSERGASSLATDLDAAIPFVKAFIIPYLGWYVFIFAVMFYFLLKERKLYYRTLWTLLAGLFVCYFVYYVFQTVAPRPIVTGDDGLARLVRFVYSQDGRYNCFPSIHCFTSFLMMRALNSASWRTIVNQTVIYTAGTLIILSTLLVKQHVVIDALSAILLANAVFAAISRWSMTWREVVVKGGGAYRGRENLE